jgi:hypothetical protein
MRNHHIKHGIEHTFKLESMSGKSASTSQTPESSVKLKIPKHVICSKTVDDGWLPDGSADKRVATRESNDEQTGNTSAECSRVTTAHATDNEPVKKRPLEQEWNISDKHKDITVCQMITENRCSNVHNTDDNVRASFKMSQKSNDVTTVEIPVKQSVESRECGGDCILSTVKPQHGVLQTHELHDQLDMAVSNTKRPLSDDPDWVPCNKRHEMDSNESSSD